MNTSAALVILVDQEEWAARSLGLDHQAVPSLPSIAHRGSPVHLGRNNKVRSAEAAAATGQKMATSFWGAIQICG